jgi:hypothetical protein
MALYNKKQSPKIMISIRLPEEVVYKLRRGKDSQGVQIEMALRKVWKQQELVKEMASKE